MEQFFLRISIMLVPELLAITVHEVSHGLAADRLGDPTARLLGRLTLNPLRHLDPIGTIALLLVGFGWARPVPVNFANLHQPRRDMIWVALVGPLSNFTLAILSGLLLSGIAHLPAGLASLGIVASVIEPVELMAAFSLYINVILGLFNLLPIPPLDGGRVLTGLLPPRQAAALTRFEPFGFVLLIVLIFFTDLWRVVLEPIIAYLVGIIAGAQITVVHEVVKFLLSR